MTKRSAPDWLTKWEYAHRGLHGEGIPENSLEAARLAVLAGHGIECDIQMSRDGVPMVFHDWELDRLTGHHGATADLASAELEEQRLLGTDQTLCRLSSLLASIAGKAPVLIEIKSRPDFDCVPACDAVCTCLATYSGQHAVMSFDPRVSEWFARNDPDCVRGLVGTDSYKNGFESMWRVPRILTQAEPDFLAIDIREVDRPEAATLRAAGMPVLTWTVRDADTRAKALAHADAIIAEGNGIA